MFSKIKHKIEGRQIGIFRIFAAIIICGFVLIGCPTDSGGKGGTREPVPDFKREMFVINGLAETLSIINPEAVREQSGEYIYNDVLTVGKWPNHILHYDDKLYVTSSGENNITVYDESTFTWEGGIDLGTNSNPWMVVPKPGTATGYVTNFVAGDVAVVDLDSYEVRKRIEVGRGPEGAVYLDGRLYVCNTNWDYDLFGFRRGSVTVIDTNTDTVEKTIDIEDAGYAEGEGCNPQSAVAFGAPIHEVHVICTGNNGGEDSDDGEIVVIDADPASPDFLTAKERVAIGGSPIYSAGSIDEARGIVYLSGVGGLQAYDYGDGTPGSIEVLRDSGDYIVAGDDPEFDFYSGTVYDEVNDIIFVAIFTYDKIIALDGDPPSYEKLAEFTAGDGVQSPVFVVED